jgi:hypothetical protein
MSGIGGIVARLAVALGMLAALQSAADAEDYRIDDRVQAYVSGVWYDGTIVGFGSGDYAGEYYVKFDQGGRSYYVNADNVRPLARGTPAGPVIPGARFTPGVYECLLGDQYFMLKLGGDLVYQQTLPEAEPGNYELDNASGTIRFTTGPYAIGQWTAEVHNAADRAGVILHADQDYQCRAAR